jgi:UTP--glucose-1-phosphate uridylyltransferase
MKSVIMPVAGWGTRALPASKAIPKEMFPVFDRPIVQHIVDEAVQSEIERVVFVTSKGKQSIEDHFDIAPDLENILMSGKKNDLLKVIKDLSRKMTVQSVRQKEQLGLGHAIWMGRDFISESHFGVMLGDDLVVSKTPGMQQLKEAHRKLASKAKSGAGLVMLMEVPDSEVSKYGICEVKGSKIVSCIEKPKPSQTKSRLAIVGRYLLPKEIFGILEAQRKGELGEIQLTDALHHLATAGNLYPCILSGRRFDAGDRLGFLEANIYHYLQSPLRKNVIQLLKESLNETV